MRANRSRPNGYTGNQNTWQPYSRSTTAWRNSSGASRCPRVGRHRLSAVIYFFSRGAEFMQCEVHPGSPHVLTVIAPGTAEHEEYESFDKLRERLDELTRHLNRDGWQGPFGRDARS